MFCVNTNIIGQRKIVKGIEKALKMPSPITTGKGLSKFPPYVPIVNPSQLPPTNSGTFLRTPAWQVIKFVPKSVNLLSHPNIDFIHDKIEYNPNFPNLRPQSIPNDPTFVPQEEKRDWFDQWIKEQDLQEIFEEFNFDIDWEKERDDLYYAIIIEKYGRAITEAA